MAKMAKVPAYPHEDALDGTVVSSSECTGLVQAPPQDDGEADAYRNLCDIPIGSDEEETEGQ